MAWQDTIIVVDGAFTMQRYVWLDGAQAFCVRRRGVLQGLYARTSNGTCYYGSAMPTGAGLPPTTPGLAGRPVSRIRSL